MKKKSIFKASFEESLNLLDDEISGKYVEDLYQDALKKEKYRGTLKSYVWQIILTLIFVIGLNWGFLAVNSYHSCDCCLRNLSHVPLYDARLLQMEIS